MAKRLVTVCALLLLAGGAAADGTGPEGDRVRNWAVGWEDGVTVRRALGPWDLSLAAGPDDWLSEDEVYRWDSSWPDSLQGQLDRESDSRRESGFVRLGAGRELTAWQTLSLHGTLAGEYRWLNGQDKWIYYEWSTGSHDRRITDYTEDIWTVSLGLRIAWRPVPIVGIQTRLGLRYRASTGTNTTTRYDPYEQTWSREERPEQVATFSHYGYGGTGSLEFFVWF